nr:hypothetical protein [Tanacetum cinerariifolium]GEW81495.1 hypothetical protein [Tanacetum cinerariifolium]
MTSFDYRLNPLHLIKECSSCGALYTMDYCCSNGSLRDKIICDLNKTPDMSQRPPQNRPKYGNPVDGLLNTSESSNDNPNVVYAPKESFVVKQDPGKNSSQSPPHINHHCCYGCGDSLEDIFFHQCTCESCGKDQSEDFSESNKDSTSIDDDCFSIDNIESVEASPPDSELVSLEVVEIVIPKTKSSSTSLNFLLEETNTFDNSLPESETFCFNSEEISSGSTTTRSNISLPDYEAFYDNHVKEISSGSTTTHFYFSLYDSFIFDLSINPFPPANWSDFYHEEFDD